MGEMAPDTAHSAVITDHDFSPKEGQEWGLCRICGLSQATHERVPKPYIPTSPYRCATCIASDKETCTHHG